MKIRRSIFCLLATLAVLTVVLVRYGKKPFEPTSPAVPTETNDIPQLEAQLATVQPNRPVSTVLRSTPQGQVTADTSATTLPKQAKGEQIKEGLATLNDVPIVFYGKLEDQFGNPVAGAEVTGSVRIDNGFRSSADRVSVTSDINGLFQLKSGNGESLGVMPRKAGYVLAETNTEFKYSYLYPDSRHVPNPNNPVIIKMRRLKGAEPLVGINKQYRFPLVSTPLFFDLLTGKLSDSGGDLQVVITRAPGSISKRSPGDWSIEFKPVNGGIMESDDATARVTYEAPIDGYQGSYVVQMNHESPAWFDNIQKVFFLMSRGGQVHSKFTVDFVINNEANGAVYFQFRGIANDHSSRNWEESQAQ